MGDGDKNQKYMFDLNSFDTPDQEEEVAPEPTYTEIDLEKVKEDSFQYGKSLGVEETRQAQEEVLIALLKQVETLLIQLMGAEMRREEEKNNAIIHLSLKMAQKLFPQWGAETAIDEIEYMVKDILAQRKDEPRLVITVHDSLLDKLQERIDGITAQAGFQGAVILMTATDLLQTDCRIEWADGGAEKNFDQIFAALESTLSKQLSHKNAEKPDARDVAQGSPSMDMGTGENTETSAPEPVSEPVSELGPAPETTETS